MSTQVMSAQAHMVRGNLSCGGKAATASELPVLMVSIWTPAMPQVEDFVRGQPSCRPAVLGLAFP
jgi:hypothetical protein